MLRQARRVPPLADVRDEWIALPSPHAASSMTNPQRLARCVPAVAMESQSPFFDTMPLFLKLQLSRLTRPLAHVCTRRVSPSPRLCTKSHAVRPCSPFSTCAPSTLSPLYLCAAAVPGNHPHGHCCTWPLLPSIEGYPQGARRAAQLVTCSARVPRTRSRMLLCGPLDLAASQGAYALQPRVLRVRSAAAIPRTHGQPLRPLWRRFSISSPLGALSLRCGLPPNRVFTVYTRSDRSCPCAAGRWQPLSATPTLWVWVRAGMS